MVAYASFPWRDEVEWWRRLSGGRGVGGDGGYASALWVARQSRPDARAVGLAVVFNGDVWLVLRRRYSGATS